MVPAGYLLKRVPAPPAYLAGAPLEDVCSAASCINDNVVDVQSVWKHNSFGVANDPALLWSMAAELNSSPDEVTLFYYEAYEEEIDSDGWTIDPDGWRPLSAVPSAGMETAVVAPSPPLRATLIGYDVVVFGDFLEHSPLSCNHIATELPVNRRCLFDTLDAAKAAIDAGAFGGGCEEGIYRIFSVSVVAPSPERR